MNQLLSDNAVILIIAYLVFVVLMFRKEIAQAVKKFDINKFLLSLDDVLSFSRVLYKSFEDGKLSPEEFEELIKKIEEIKEELK